MNARHGRLTLVLSLGFLVLLLEAPMLGTLSRARAYTPSPGHRTTYDYGFISTQPNLTASDIHQWTGLNLTGTGYTLHWQQFVNLSIAVVQVAAVANLLRVLYEFSVLIHSNRATVSNSSYQETVTLNGSTQAPAPTGVPSGFVDLPVYVGLAGFFLDDTTLSTLRTGPNVTIGGSLWQSITLDVFTLNGHEETCYLLHNQSILVNASIQTTYRIDQDVGLYFWANETHTLTDAGLNRTLTYYYTVLESTVPLAPLPNLLPLLTVVAVAAIVLAIVVALFVRALWLRRRRSQLLALSEP